MTYDPGRICVRYKSEIHLPHVFIWQTDTLCFANYVAIPMHKLCNSLVPVRNQEFCAKLIGIENVY